MGLRLYHVPFYLVNDPDLIQGILLKNHRNFLKPTGLQVVKPMFGNGLLTSDDEIWRRQRVLVADGFRRERVQGHAATVVDTTARFVESWNTDQVRNIHDDMNRLTLEIVARALFGADIATGRVVITAGAHAIQEFFNSWRKHYLPPMPSWMPIPSYVRLRRAVRELDRLVYALIASRRASGDRSADLLSRMLDARDEDGRQMTDRQLRDELVTLFLAGHETTAAALSWAWYLLAENPGVRHKLHDELDRVLGNRVPEVANLADLPYLDKVVKETLRLYPSAYNIGRLTREACEIGGYPIGKGTNVIMCQWAVHRSPRHFDDPEAFRPERWTDELIGRLHKFAYFPFSAGPRNCVGAQFALTEAKLILATMARRFVLDLQPGTDVRVDAALTLRPMPGLPMVVRARTKIVPFELPSARPVGPLSCAFAGVGS